MAVRFRAAIDGGSRGNPGPAAWAVAVLDESGGCVEGHHGSLGRATNNVAEYRALLEALRLAEERAAEDVAIQADSELVVRQILGRYKVKHPDLKPLFEEAKRRIGRFRSFGIRHVPRGENAHADRLVNEALDAAAETSAQV
jgi:probable phosphoglycerate mutase